MYSTATKSFLLENRQSDLSFMTPDFKTSKKVVECQLTWQTARKTTSWSMSFASTNFMPHLFLVFNS